MFCYFHDPESIIYSESPFDHIDFYVHVEIYQTQIICACMLRTKNLPVVGSASILLGVLTSIVRGLGVEGVDVSNFRGGQRMDNFGKS
jgi:hypothetical protein